METVEQELNKLDIIESALIHEDTENFRELFLDLHPYDQAVFFQALSKKERMKVYSYLSPKEISDIIENIDLEDSEEYIVEMDPRFATMVFAEMAVDDAVDILQELTNDQVASFLAIMDEEAAGEIKGLLHYEEKTAGSIMTTEYVSFIETQTAKETLQQMKELAPDA